jgi:BirA family biotin operon repressor/biotin-[acetyl-CoA-carboxylase] ligase
MLFDSDNFDALLQTSSIGRNFDHHQFVSSTMDIARERSISGCPHGTLILAEAQSAGRGRKGRSFYSPDSGNLYFSLVLRLSKEAHSQLPVILPLSVVKACFSSNVETSIKWPNDIFIGDRKVAGMIVDAEISKDVRVALVGIGINVNGEPSENPELRDSAISLKQFLGVTIQRERLLADFCVFLEQDLKTSSSELRKEYRNHSLLLGRSVYVQEKNKIYEATAVDIAEDGGLMVRIPDEKNLRKLIAAEVSIRSNF